MSKAVTKKFSASQEEIIKCLVATITKQGYQINAIDKEYGLITFESGMSLKSWAGQSMQAHVLETEPLSCEVILSGNRKQHRSVKQVYDWGEAKGISNQILHELSSMIPSDKELSSEKPLERGPETHPSNTSLAPRESLNSGSAGAFWIIGILGILALGLLLISTEEEKDHGGTFKVSKSQSINSPILNTPQTTESSKPSGLTVSKESVGKSWPFTVKTGVLDCISGRAAVFIANGTTYQLNGVARSLGYRSIDRIWKNDPEVPGAKINIGPMIDLALRQCK